MTTIRDLFSGRRPIDRRIEKVIDYSATDEDRLAAEIEEYEATHNVESYFRRFLERYQEGVQGGEVTEVGIWVSGFYGSGKSSFTKYLGFALDPQRLVRGRPFLDLLSDRLQSSDVKALLRRVSQNSPTAVVMLDLGAEQLLESTATPVATVLYWKVLQLAGYSREKKLAQLELTLQGRGLYDRFRDLYRARHSDEWETVHNDPLTGVPRASRLLPDLLPHDFPEPNSFSSLEFEMVDDQRTVARQMIDVVRRATGRDNILFLIDEAGQYVAPRGELILNLDGLARNLKELGQGRVWMVATGQQTLTEIVERAAYNSTELNKLRDRFPIAIELDARDIREITYRRLLTKSPEGERYLRDAFAANGPALVTHTRLTDTTLFKSDPTVDDFVRYYPFLPQHFEVLMELIRVLARSTGGLGLRSAIRVIQDILVDTSRVLKDNEKLADRSAGSLASVDDFYRTLRNDIHKMLPHVVTAVDRVERTLGPGLPLRVAQAVAALQPMQDFPRTAENIAALLYPALGSPSLLPDVRQALADLVAHKDIGLIEDPQTGGYQFLSEKVAPLITKRNDYVPTRGELDRVRNEVLRGVLEPQPAARLEGVKDVRAAVRVGRSLIIGDDEEIGFRIELTPPELWDNQRAALLTQTAQQTEFETVIAWLARYDESLDDVLSEIVRSDRIARDVDDNRADRDEMQFARAERQAAARNRERVALQLKAALLDGTFIFRGQPTPVRELGAALDSAARVMLDRVAAKVFHKYHLVNIRPNTDLAARFLEVDRLDAMPADRDPLGLVKRQGAHTSVSLDHPALAEARRVFAEKADQSGGRWLGKSAQDLFAAHPYGWSKDATRYLFAALLVGGEIEVHSGGDTLKTAGPAAVEAFKNTQAFNRVSLSVRGQKLKPEELDRAAQRLERLFGEQVLPLEEDISRSVRKRVPALVEQLGTLPSTLRLLRLPGEERAANVQAQLTEALRGDASEAAVRFGGADGQIEADVQWAQRATKALGNGGEADIGRARELLRDLDELQRLFPDDYAAVVDNGDADALRLILDSERFYEQLADLRTAMSHLDGRVRAAYHDRLRSYAEAHAEAQANLEAPRAWGLLSDADRADLAARLERLGPPAAKAAPSLADLRELLTRSDSLPKRLADLQAQVLERQPAPVAVNGGGGDSPPVPVTVEAKVITSEDELDAWLTGLRERIVAQLKAGHRVKVEA